MKISYINFFILIFLVFLSTTYNFFGYLFIEKYYPIFPLENDYLKLDELNIYLIKVFGISKGIFFKASQFNPESNLLVPTPIFPELIFFLLSKYLSFEITKIFLEIVCYLLSFTLISKVLSKFYKLNISSSYILSLFFLVTYDYLHPFYFKNFESFFSLLDQGKLTNFNRFPNISFSLPIFMLWFYFVLEYLKRPAKKYLFQFSFLLFILSFTNFYQFTFAFIFSFFAIFLTEKKFSLKIHDSVISFIFSLPYLLLYFYCSLQNNFNNWSLLAGVYEGKAISLFSIFYIFLIFPLVLLYRKNINFKFEIKIIIFSLLALIFLKNLQILFGFNVQTFHWEKNAAYIIIYITLISVFVNKLGIRLITIFMLLFVILHIFVQYKYILKNQIEITKYANFIDALEKIETKSKILTPIEYGYLPIVIGKEPFIEISPFTDLNSNELLKKYAYILCYYNSFDEIKKMIKSRKLIYNNIYHLKDNYVINGFDIKTLSMTNKTIHGNILSLNDQELLLNYAQTCDYPKSNTILKYHEESLSFSY